MEQPLVSVVVTVYNHANYIEECLRSILMQRVDFSYEVLVGEDCSPDGTAEVLRRLRPEFPEHFKFFLREQNMGAVKNGEDLYARATGTYLIGLEGDDFWTYEGKLQAQVDFLEAHPEYVAVYTRCTVVGEDSRPNGEEYPQCPFEDYSFKEYFYSRLPGQTGTCLCRREQYFASRDEFMAHKEYGFYPGDRRNAFLHLCDGKVRCIQETWSAYRHVVSKKSSSYSSSVQFNDQYARDEVLYGKAMVAFARRRNNTEALRVAQRTYFRFYLKWALDRRSSIMLSDYCYELVATPHRLSNLLAPLQWYAVLGFRYLKGIPVDL